MNKHSILAIIFLGVITAYPFTFDRSADSLALVAIKNENPGSTIDWDFSKPIDGWKGVSIINGRVDSLNLYHTTLKTIPTELGNLTACTRLILSENELTMLPQSIMNCKALTVLELYHNQLKTIPREISYLYNLTDLDLGFNQLDTLPITIAVMSRLNNLNLSMNKFSHFPGPVLSLSNLFSLDLTYNSLTMLPASMSLMRGLMDLRLDYNNLSSLSPGIGDLLNLRSLSIRWNGLVALAPEIGNLEELKDLNLSYNALMTLPAAIAQLIGVSSLHLDSNYLEEKNMDTAVIRWANCKDPGWQMKQQVQTTAKVCGIRYKKQSVVTIMGNILHFSPDPVRVAMLSIFTPSGRLICRGTISGSTFKLPPNTCSGAMLWQMNESGRTGITGKLIIR